MQRCSHWNSVSFTHDTWPTEYLSVSPARKLTTGSRLCDPSATTVQVSLAQPRVNAEGEARTSDWFAMRASTPLPPGCGALSSQVVEMLTPLFRRDAWPAVHHIVLSRQPDALLARTARGIENVWRERVEDVQR